LGRTQAGEWIHSLTPILNQVLGYEKQLPARKARDVTQVLRMCPELEFIIDGTERPIRRPKKKKKHEDNYSGKKNATRSKTMLLRRNASEKQRF
jgi:hypothetical protein